MVGGVPKIRQVMYGHVASNESSDGGWDTKRAKFGGVIGVLVEAEQVDICKVTFDGLWELVLVDEVEDKVEVVFDGGYFTFDKNGEEINRVSVDTGTFVLGSVKDSFADVAREGVGLMWSSGGWGWMVLWGNGLLV
jgi:hypothetical protein